jgi:hypothetical protein
MIAGAASGMRGLFKKMKYLGELGTSWNPNFDRFSDKEKEAILTAWSELA